jgi:hypothetical protein
MRIRNIKNRKWYKRFNNYAMVGALVGWFILSPFFDAVIGINLIESPLKRLFQMNLGLAFAILMGWLFGIASERE